MDQILNPFNDLNPLSPYMKFRNIIINIKDKKLLIEIGIILEMRLKELS
jgi:hypothetical protein|tara:strand:- start:1017 stop:1163 length:147 start_codon:yes stop_codon:yes gene_type:complete